MKITVAILNTMMLIVMIAMTMMSMNMPPWLAGTTTYQAIWLAPGGGQERAETASPQAMAASLHDNMAMVMMLHGGNADGDDHGGDDEQAPIILMTMVMMMLMMLSDDHGGDVEHEYTDGDDK